MKLRLVEIKSGVLVNPQKVIGLVLLPNEQKQIRVYFDIAETAFHGFWYSDLPLDELMSRLGIAFVNINTGLWINPAKVIGLYEQGDKTKVYFDIKEGHGSGYWNTDSSLSDTIRRLVSTDLSVDAGE